MIPQNTKIVVIDDVYKEVKSLLTTLNKNGTAFTYFKGDDYKELPDHPLKGIRLVFLDFVLNAEKMPDPKDDISTLIGVLKKIISVENGPYIILAWTKHDDDHLQYFKTQLLNNNQIPVPLAIINLEKRDCKKSLSKIARKIKQKLNDSEIIELLVQWENHANKATSEVLCMLSELAKPNISKAGQPAVIYDNYSSAWESGLERHIYRIAASSLGQNIQADKKMLIAAQISLSDIFKDQLESILRKETKDFKKLTNRISTNKQLTPYTPEEKAVMSTSFLISTRELEKNLQPGNIYKLERIREKIKCDKKECYLNKAKITPLQVVKEFYNGGEKNLRKDPQKAELLKRAVPVLMEITPECDYAQNKWRNASMILGVLWPQSIAGDASVHKKLGYKAEYIYRPLPINFNNQTYLLTFNSHYIINLDFSIFEATYPVLKARKELLVDVQNWYAKQVSRPGKIEF